jgi:3-carboxy-cis,cis-muconate cycloisomerase
MIGLLDSEIFSAVFGIDTEIAAELSDRRRAADLLEVEVALARAQAAHGVIPASAADAIAAAAASLDVNLAALGHGVAASGVPTIELIRQLRAAVGPEAAPFVHRGATSQDIVDTAAVIAWRRVQRLIDARCSGVIAALVDLARRHRRTVMAGRTHGQHAAPITFGLKAANWLAPLVRHRLRLEELKPRLFVVQLGGAAGTLSAMGDAGPAVLDSLARSLELGAAAPWHTQRDTIVEYGNWLATLCTVLGKLGQDVILLTQTEVAEAAESGDAGRGTSSTMPHKANPIASEMLVVSARAAGALVAALHASAIQEHERGTHGWQLEWYVMSQLLALAYGSASNATLVTKHLQPDPDRMRANISGGGDIVAAEALAFALSCAMPLDDARSLVARAAAEIRDTRTSLVDAVRHAAAARGLGGSLDWNQLADPSAQLGAADAFIDRIVNDAKLLRL